jgi:hypothetical protein
MCVTYCLRTGVLYWNHDDCAGHVSGSIDCHRKANYASNYPMTKYASRKPDQAIGSSTRGLAINRRKDAAREDGRALG